MIRHATASVVVPCHDAEATVVRAVESVAAQTVAPAEVILVDDASRDGTAGVIDTLCGRRWPFVLRATRLAVNRGPGEARNEGWARVADGSTYVAFLDADDIWLPRKLECQLAWMEAHDDVAWSAHRCGVLGSSAAPEQDCSGVTAMPITRTSLLRRNSVATPTVVVRAEVRDRFRPGWRWCEDLMLWIDWLDHGHRGVMLDATLAMLGRRPKTSGGATGNRRAMYSGERRVVDTLASERRLTPFAACAWRGYAWVRYLRRRVIA
ncbi:MAG: glycosyltransferase family 2 protein [Planctomycetaceae bacterium]